MSGDAVPSNPEPIDMARVVALNDLLGPARVVALLGMLSSRVEAIAAVITVRRFAREQVIAAVHQSQGSAGSLGLNEIMGRLQHLENVISLGEASPSYEQAEAAALVLALKQARQALEKNLPEFTRTGAYANGLDHDAAGPGTPALSDQHGSC